MPIDAAQAKANYSGSASIAGQRYKTKVLANSTWHDKATSPAAEQNYGAGVQAAVASGRRAKALGLVTQSQWQQQASTRGATNIVSGIQAKADKQSANFAPYIPVIDAAVAANPPRGQGYMANRVRLDNIALALEAKKKEIKG